MFTLLLLFILTDAGASDASWADYVRSCPIVREALSISEQSGVRGSNMKLMADETWAPHLFLRRAQSANYRGRLLETSYGITGVVPSIPHWLLLRSSANTETDRRTADSESIVNETFETFREDYFRLQRLMDSLPLLKDVQTLLEKRASVSTEHLSSENVQAVMEANLMISRIEELRAKTAALESHFAECDVSLRPKWTPPEVTASDANKKNVASLKGKVKSCAAEIEKGRMDMLASRWAWLPQIRYSFANSFEINDPAIRNSDWSVSLQMQLPIFSFGYQAVKDSACQLQVDRARKKDEERFASMESDLEVLPRLRSGVDRMKKLLPAIAEEARSGNIPLKKYTDLVRDLVQTVERVSVIEGQLASYREDHNL